MLIQPVQPVFITIKIGENKYECQMVSLSEHELEISCNDYLEKDSQVFFVAKYFKGNAVIRDIQFAQYYFTYKMEIERIQFQPGLLINTRL
ncbi:hypothetical protein [Legionella shakespearei]|uniref:Uncharacterized protein n=1 Tax=Legionella shakespearei DSM 23087 TaxID=1122169 RepID=A0A0W0YKW3_9GAMM|nr:hypothetical protein [Legionella shakespearei]KTD57564.1 hypothetical protein Lsha_2405 [Legionella shakespearei DSM 23087]